MDRLTCKFEGILVLTGADGRYSPDTFAAGSADFDFRRQGGIVKPSAVFVPAAELGVLSDDDRLFNNRNLLSHPVGIRQGTAAIRVRIKRAGLVIINLIRCKRRPFMFGMTGVTADLGLSFVFVFSRRLANMRGWWLRRVGGIIRELSDFVCELSYLFGRFSVDFNKRGNFYSQCGCLHFKLCDILNAILFCSGSQIR